MYLLRPIDLPICVLNRPEMAADARFLVEKTRKLLTFGQETRELLYLSMGNERASLFFNRDLQKPPRPISLNSNKSTTCLKKDN